MDVGFVEQEPEITISPEYIKFTSSWGLELHGMDGKAVQNNTKQFTQQFGYSLIASKPTYILGTDACLPLYWGTIVTERHST